LYACHQYLETVFGFTLLAYLLNQNSHCALYIPLCHIAV